MKPTKEALIDFYQLKPLEPEGGFFTRSYCSAKQIPQMDRPISTAIYYLLLAGARSLLHRIASDEIWHFYLGGSLTIEVLHPDGRMEQATLGPDILNGQKVQYVVPAGAWFGALPCPGTEYSFVGCTVAPGFDYADFELADRAKLLAEFPHARALIERLT